MLRFVLLFISGLFDSIRLTRVIHYFLISGQIRSLFLYCFLLNAVLFLGLVFSYQFFIEYLVNSNNIIGNFLKNFQFVFDIIYYPILLIAYLISFILSSFWFGDISEAAILVETKVYDNKNFVSRNIDGPTRIRNEIVHIFIVIFFFMQIAITKYLPYIGGFLELLHYSFLYSLYCFEYKWGTDSYLMKNLAFFEENSPYFMGFGFLFALSTKYFPFLMSTGIYAVMFPFFMLTAIKATPPSIKMGNSLMFLKNLLMKKTVEYSTIKEFEYNSKIYENNQKWGVFYFARKGIKLIELMVEKMVAGKLE